MKLLTSSYRPRLKNVKLPNYTRSRLRSLTGTGCTFMYNAYISLFFSGAFPLSFFLHHNLPGLCREISYCHSPWTIFICLNWQLPSPTLLIYPPTSTYILLTKSHLCRRSSFLISFSTITKNDFYVYIYTAYITNCKNPAVANPNQFFFF